MAIALSGHCGIPFNLIWGPGELSRIIPCTESIKIGVCWWLLEMIERIAVRNFADIMEYCITKTESDESKKELLTTRN